MPHCEDAKGRICQLLDMDDRELAAEMERDFLLSENQHMRICDTLGEMIQEVDRLISCLDDMEDWQPDEEDKYPISR
jgi:hypothetical protein